jgi:phosphoglycerate dehydrogenase-like enzyme
MTVIARLSTRGRAMVRVAVLDDYQGVALDMADWSPLDGRAEITVFREPFRDEEAAAAALGDYEVLVAMRERTAFPDSLLRRLPKLRLLVTTGMRNSAIDIAAARDLGVVVSGTDSPASSTVEHTWALILAWSRHLVEEAENMAAGRWQTTLGTGLAGKTLGIVGLGRIGAAVAAVGTAFGMRVVAWSEHLTPERAEAAGAQLVDLDDLLSSSDVVTVHEVLSARTRHLIGASQLALMRPTALLVNTSRGPVVSSAALVAAVSSGLIAGAAVDVYDDEPPPSDHPIRSSPAILATPHLGYVTREVYQVFYGEAVEDIVGFLEGVPVRRIEPAM